MVILPISKTENFLMLNSTTCLRSLTFQVQDADLIGLRQKKVPTRNVNSNQRTDRRHSRKAFGPMHVLDKGLHNEEILHFRNIHYLESQEPIESIHEAEKILKNAPYDSRALRYQALWRLCQPGLLDLVGLQETISLLERAIVAGKSKLNLPKMVS